MKLNKALVFGVVAVVAAAVVWTWWTNRDPMRSAAFKVLHCVQDGNAGCLTQYAKTLPNSEVLASDESLSAVLNHYVGPVLADLTKEGDPIYEANPGYEQAMITQRYKRRDGEHASLVVLLHKGDDGPIAPYLVSHLIMFTHEAKYFEPMQGERRALTLTRAWVKGAKQDSQELNDLGVVRMVRTNKEGAMDWPAYIALQESRLVKLEAAAEVERKQAHESHAGSAEASNPK